MPSDSMTPEPELDLIEGDGNYSTDIVGESRYQDALERICSGRTREGQEKKVTATLNYEDSNPHDHLAVRIDIESQTVGYLDRNLARKLRKILSKRGFKGSRIQCNAMIVGGWDRGEDNRGHFGVKLDMS